jgi:hypothetical protein
MDQLDEAVSRLKRWTTEGRSQEFVKNSAEQEMIEGSLDAQSALKCIHDDNIEMAMGCCVSANRHLVNARHGLRYLQDMRAGRRAHEA